MGRKNEQFRVELEFDKFIKHGTFQMFHSVARSNQLTLQQKGIYSMLASYAFSLDQKSWPSYKRLAEEAGVSPRYVRTIINQLAEFGLVRKRQRNGDSNVYTLVFPDGELLAKLFPDGYKTGDSNAQEGGSIVPEGWNNSSTEGGTIVPGGWNNSSTEEKEENIEEENKKKKRNKSKKDEQLEQQIQELWDYWQKSFEGVLSRSLSLTKERRKCIKDRLTKDKFAVDDLKKYIDYVRRTPFYLEKRVFYIENIMNNASQVERGLDIIQSQEKPAVNQSNGVVGGGMYQNADEFLDKLFD